MLTFATLVLGGIWRQENYEIYEIAALYLLTIPALLLTLMITPIAGRVRQGPLRAQKQGQDAAPLVGRPLGELDQPGHPRGDRAGGRHARRHVPPASSVRRIHSSQPHAGTVPPGAGRRRADGRLLRPGFPVLPAPIRQAGQDVLRPLPLRRLVPPARRRLDPVDGVRADGVAGKPAIRSSP